MYFDRSAHFDFWRTTAFNKNNIEKFNRALPLIETVDRGFKELIPGRYKKQKQMIKATDPNYRISNTAFTTITINKNYRTTYHYDGNDYSLGFGNLVAFCRDIEPMYLVIPNGPSPMRLSFVMYYRENMWKCLPPKKELERIQMNQRAVAQRYLMGEK